jgi:hypothetical protein
MALKSLMQCALLAAQQPQTLAYASAQSADLKPAAADCQPGTGEPAQHGTACRSAADVAEAAAQVWLGPPGHHLGSLASLGPLFEPRQQQPCLVRFLQLLVQYNADAAAAAHSTLQRLEPELKRRGLWVPPGSSNSSSSSSSSSSHSDYIPADRSRLLVLLVGLYHLTMLEEQQGWQHKQQWQKEQRQREQEWGSKHGSQQQQQQHRQNGRHATVAAAAAGSVYDDPQVRLAAAAAAVDAAYGLQELLMYCLVPVEQHATPGTTTTSSSSSSSSSKQVAGGPWQRWQNRK